VPVSPTLTAATTTDSYCIALPNPNQFFRVAQGLAPAPFGPVGAGLTSSLKLTRTSSNASLNWSGSSTQKFRINGANTGTTSMDPRSPTKFSATNGTFNFKDDGTQTGGLGPNAASTGIVPVTRRNTYLKGPTDLGSGRTAYCAGLPDDAVEAHWAEAAGLRAIILEVEGAVGR